MTRSSRNRLPTVGCLLLTLAPFARARDRPGRVRDGITDREGVLPDHIANSEGLVHGAEFQDLIRPLPSRGGDRAAPKWGTTESRVRDAGYGIEDDTYSYWGSDSHFGH